MSGSDKVGAAPPAIALRRVNKRFGAVYANRDVSLTVAPGTIHGIVGENGAGKSTLMSILYGFYEADSGEIHIDGQPVRIRSTQDAIAAGIGMVHQHFMLVDTFTVLENVMLGAERGALLKQGMVDARAELERLERDYGLEVDPDARVSDLPVGLEQRVEILKALYRGARILILDEPSGVLTPQEADALFDILRSLRSQGVTVILITHKLREIMAVTDTVSVMRQGQMVAERRTAQTGEEELAELMVGRKVLLKVDKTPAEPAGAALEVQHLCITDARGVERVRDVSFNVRAGEIVGIAGVSGNGQSELLEALAGIRPVTSGVIEIEGSALDASTPRDGHSMREIGLAHVPEDRLRRGLVRSFTASESSILGYQDRDEYNGVVLMKGAAIRSECADNMRGFDVRPSEPRLRSENFSGGNQQKLVLAREMRRNPKLLLVGQPTRGVDIGAIEFIHKRIVEMRDAGAAVLLVSVELDEIMSLADRIIVMCGGRIVGEMPAASADERSLGLMMANVGENDRQPTGGAA